MNIEKRNGKFRARVSCGNGKYKYTKTYESKRKAEEAGRLLEVERDRDRRNKENERDDPPLGQAIDRYIAAKEHVLSPSTVKGYKNVRRNYISELMDIRLSELRQELVQSVFNTEAQEHSRKTLKNARGLLSSTMKMFGYPTPQITLGKQEKREIYVPDEQEVADILEKVKSWRGGKLTSAYLLATQCGLRASEICALTVKDIKENQIVINKALIEGEIRPPKSRAGYRNVPISSEMATYLRENAAENGRLVDMLTGYLCGDWSKFKTDSGIDTHLNFHALRHHFASRLLLDGVPQKYIAALMGHTDTKMIEQVYQHTFQSAMAGFAVKITSDNAEFMKAV